MSAGFAYRNSRIARKALELSANTSKLAGPNSNIYLVDAFRYRLTDSNIALHVFCLSIENKSTMQNSVTAAELRIPFVRDGIERIAVFRNVSTLARSEPLRIQNFLQIPAALTARSALVANCCFEVPLRMLEGAEFGPYRLRIVYAEGPASNIEFNVMMDVIDAEHLEKKRNTGVPI